MSSSKKHHDQFFKRSLQDANMVRDFLCQYVDPQVIQHIDMRSLKIQQGSFVTKNLKYRMSDVLYAAKINNKKSYLYFLLEHQSTPDKKMSLRMRQYVNQIMDMHLQQGHEYLPIVLPFCLYHGQQSPYPYGTSFYDPKFRS